MSEKQQAPTVIDDTLEGGARWLHNIDDKPVWVETKTQYKEELAKRGLVPDVRDDHAKIDQSPWATKTRLRHGGVDPFLPDTTPEEVPLSIDRPPELPVSTGMQEKGTGTLGEDSTAQVQSIQMSIEQVRRLREYARLITDGNLESRLYCSQCFDGQLDRPCQVSVSKDQVFIVCDCTIRYANAATPLSPRVELPTRPPQILELSNAVDVPWPHEAAEVFRRYRKEVLLPLGLKEALRCMDCYERNQLDGTKAHVTTSALSITCRCQHRHNTGISA